MSIVYTLSDYSLVGIYDDLQLLVEKLFERCQYGLTFDQRYGPDIRNTPNLPQIINEKFGIYKKGWKDVIIYSEKGDIYGNNIYEKYTITKRILNNDYNMFLYAVDGEKYKGAEKEF